MLKTGDEVSIRIGHAQLAQNCLVTPAYSTFCSPTHQNNATKSTTTSAIVSSASNSAIATKNHRCGYNSIFNRKPQSYTATIVNNNYNNNKRYCASQGNHSHSHIHHSSSWVGERNSVSKALAAAGSPIVVDPASSRGYKNVSVATTLTRRSICSTSSRSTCSNNNNSDTESSIHAQNAPNLKQFFATACYCNSPDCCEVRKRSFKIEYETRSNM